jgi:dipeptidyl-peptidase 4
MKINCVIVIKIIIFTKTFLKNYKAKLFMILKNRLTALIFLLLTPLFSFCQIEWIDDDKGFYNLEKNEINLTTLPEFTKKVILKESDLVPTGQNGPLKISKYKFSSDKKKILLFTNTKKVWRYETKGDYWVFDLGSKNLKQLGKNLPESSLMFAKFSPDAGSVAYVSKNNIYVENLANNSIKKITQTNGSRKLINGTFDWAYEEEFGCRDGFRWSPNGKSIAFWQIDANTIRDFNMINTTDSIYSFTIPIEYPKVGETPSSCKIGVVDIATAKTKWMLVPGDNRQHYIPRMEWASNEELIIQQLNRKQNESKLMYLNAKSGLANTFYQESDKAWVDIRSSWNNDNPAGWEWIENGKAFLWISEKDGWRHIYRISKDGKSEKLLSKGNYDVISPAGVDEKNGLLYFLASPNNATEKYLYKIAIDGSNEPQKISPEIQEGTHNYQMSPNAVYAQHSFSNYYTSPLNEWISVSQHQALVESEDISKKIDPTKKEKSNVSFFKITTQDGIEMDGWMAKPKDFDPSKKYPVLFMVYGEPASQTVVNRWGAGKNGLYDGNMAEDGYIYISVENRGAPAPKGREWRKSIYRNIGIINIRDQAMACKKIIETYPFVDASRIAVHGWSGGGSSTLNLLFQYPELYQTGISVAAVANQLTYDNIYQERYMGVPQENKEDFIKGSPITHAKNLIGNLLYIHGTGDDNVHYQNAELLINELVKHNKQFQLMAYPNRSHSISEGEGTRKHLNALFTKFLKENCPPGAK